MPAAFHNDVVAASHQNVLLHHELAFEDATEQLCLIADRYQTVCGTELTRVEVPEKTLAIEDAVHSYLFNSQIVSASDSGSPPILICPSQVESHPAAHAIAQSWLQAGLFSELRFVDLAQSMAGGGGPACLRLRVPVSEDELGMLPQQMFWSEQLDAALRDLIHQHYPTRVVLEDLADEAFVRIAEQATALAEQIIWGRANAAQPI